MDIPKAYSKDSHGALTSTLYKVDIEQTCLTSTVHHNESGEPVLSVIYDNIAYDRISAGVPTGYTYKFVMSYMGTMGRKDLYSQIVMNESGELTTTAPPRFDYTVGGLMYESAKPSDVILNVNFYTGEANILQFKGVPVGGNNPPFQNVYKYSYPFTATMLPNRAGTESYFDGWYNNVYVVFTDIVYGDVAVKGDIYGHKGTTGLAAVDGTFAFDGETLQIIDAEGEPHAPFTDTETYEEVMLAIGRLSGDATGAPGLMADSQILVTEELNNAIINELKEIACDPACDDTCSIADWQKLQQKRLGAYIHFTEGNFRKSQVIVESSRKTCSRTDKSCGK